VARKVIVTCAVTGNAPFNPKHPSFPVSPAEIAAAVEEAARAGAAIAHVHVRDPNTRLGSRDPKLFKETVDRVRDLKADIVLNLTCGHAAFLYPDPEDESRALPISDVAGVEERIAHLVECQPEIASIDVATGNQVEGDAEFVYLNTTRTLRAMASCFRELGIKPEIEIFEVGDLLFGNQLITEGLVEDPPFIQMVLGVKWASPADTRTVEYLKAYLPEGAIWTAMGIAREQMPMAVQSVLLGGHVRVGLEDNLYLSQGRFATNGELVQRAVEIIERLGCSPATADEARDMLGIRSCR